MTVEAEISKPSNAQRDFRQIVEATGCKLVNNKIVGADGDDSAGVTPAAISSPKKRKSSTKEDTNDEDSKKKRKLYQPASEPTINGGKIKD